MRAPHTWTPRVKGAWLRGDAARLEAIRRLLLATDGVTAVAPNLITGSILVNYDVAILQPKVLNEQLRRIGFSSSIRTLTDEGSFERLAETLVRKLFEHTVETLAMTAIEAVI